MRLMNIRNGRAGGAARAGLGAAITCGDAGRVGVALMASARTMRITVTAHAETRIQGLETSLTDLSCPRLSALAADQEQGVLPLQRPPRLSVGAHDHVFLLRHPHRLTAPFRHGGRGLELDRKPHRWNHARL